MSLKVYFCTMLLALNLVCSSLAANASNNNNKNSNNNNNNNNNNNGRREEQSNQEIWNQDLTDTFKIEGSDQGIQKVNLKCGSDSMNIILETEKPFTGVMYTRGSFYKQSAPCFVKPQTNSARSLEMKFQLDQCQTLNDNDLYSNIVVIQNDPELITPGDSAFSVECDFRQPRNLNVEANMQTRDRIAVGSKITLTSPDPGAQQQVNDEILTLNTVASDTNTVEYIPKHKNDHQKHQKPMHMGTVEEIKLNIEKDEL